ncbi:MAG: iron-sulfur cluster biosynthesis family protein [Tissierellia bacterium]|nr:iron-sulfur cluster biosynthesis family protein [Tissierellia bacterium]
MQINISNKARKMLEESLEGRPDKLLKLKMVKYDCHGPVIALSLTGQDEAQAVVEAEGFRFSVDPEEEKLFEQISIDYEDAGIDEGFQVRAESSSLGKCFFTDEVE